jgi:hypothetical protein
MGRILHLVGPRVNGNPKKENYEISHTFDLPKTRWAIVHPAHPFPMPL